MLTEEELERFKEELEIFRAVNNGKILRCSGHANMYAGNSIRAAIFNQGVARAKLRDYIDANGTDSCEMGEKNVSYRD